MRIIKVRTCKTCPFYYRKSGLEDNHPHAHGCHKLVNGEGYKPYDECLDPRRYYWSISENCPLEFIDDGKTPTICTKCAGDGTDVDLRHCTKCSGNGYVLT